MSSTLSNSAQNSSLNSPLLARSVESDYQSVMLINDHKLIPKYSSSLTEESYLSSTMSSPSPNNINLLLSNQNDNNSSSDLPKSNSNMTKTKSRMHPNIHHRPAIKHHHRPSLSSLNTKTNQNNHNNNNNNNNTCEGECPLKNNKSNRSASTDLLLNDRTKENILANGQNNTISADSSKDKHIELENEIKKLQEAIDKLNYEIFKNPNNCTRPPSEYIELFTHMTSELHNLQVKKQILINNQNSQNLCEQTNDSNNNSPNLFDLTTNNEDLNHVENGNDNCDPRLIGSPSNESIKSFDSCNIPAINENLPRLKLEHPTSLYSQNSTTTKDFKFSYDINKNEECINNDENLNYETGPNYNHNQMFPIMESSTLPTPVSLNSNNQDFYNNNTISNRSYADFTEVNSINSNNSSLPINGGVYFHATPTTLSPTTSMATTPTYISINGLRVYIGSSTTVVEKKAIPLRDLLSKKLEFRDLDVDKCVAYIKDANLRIDWDTEATAIDSNDIVVTELSDELRHNFEKKTFTLRSCSCKKRFLLNVYSCIKCDYIMCQRNECRIRSEKVLCIPRVSSKNSSSSIQSTNTAISSVKQDSEGNSNRSDLATKDSPIINNFSQQILSLNQLKDKNRTVQKSPSSTPKSSNNINDDSNNSNSSNNDSNNITKNIYNTMPRNQYSTMIKKSIQDNNHNLLDDISGSISNESGSVINSLISSSGQENGLKFSKSNNNNVSRTNYTKQHTPIRRDSFNSWEIPFKQITIDKNSKVGSGSFGIVHQGRDIYHGIVAIKFLNVQNPSLDQAKAFRNEVNILKSTRHDNILLFIGCILRPYLAIVTEWCPGSSLYRHLHVEEESWDMLQIVDIIKQTATGMEYLHAKDILHRDLKSNNIFLIPKETAMNVHQYTRHNKQNQFDDYMNEQSERWRVKIGDFGLATVKSKWTQSSNNQKNQPTGSILWMAPEVITQKVSEPYTQKSDVYSFAVVLYELVTGHLPYLKKEQNMILFLVGSGRLKLNPDDSRNDTPDELKELIVTCSQYEREKRLDFVQINEKLKNIKLAKTKSNIKRAQSLPNLKLFQELSLQYRYGHFAAGVYDDVLMYPTTPQPDSMMNKLHSPIQSTNFNDY